MADFDAEAVLTQISAGLTKFSESVKVIGEPIEAAGKVVIPAVVARTGFGAGGGGGGGAVMMTPVFLIVDAEGERLLTVPNVPPCLSSAVDSIKSVMDSLKARRGKEDKPE